MLRTLLLAALVASSAAAQTTPADVFPLDQGARWTYLVTEWSSVSGSYSSSYLGAVEWLVDGTVDVGGETLPVLQITADGTTESCAVGTEVDGSVISFPFYGADGTGDCPAVELGYYDGTAFRTGVQVDLAAVQPAETVVIGGRPYTDLEVLYGFYTYTSAACGWACDATYQVALGVGVFGFGYTELIAPGTTTGQNWVLRLAEVGGETFGAPLDPGPGFFPLAPGDTWVFAITSRTGGSATMPSGFVVWTVDGAGSVPVLHVERVLDGERTPLGACVATVEPASAANGFRQVTRLDDAPDAACPRDLPFALPALDPTGLFVDGDGAPGVSVNAFTEDETVLVGSQAVTADEAHGSAYDLLSPSGPVFRTEWSLGRDLGVLVFEAAGEGPGFGSETWTARLEYALVGGTGYGANPVDGEAAAPGEVALALTVGPNPARGAARLTLAGEARQVRVSVLDALGRVVAEHDGAPGTLELDTSAWAAGVYTVRAVADGGLATARLTVAR